MAKEHDIIVVGGGHNALTCAAYLVKAGLDVCVVERNPNLGGAACTLEGPVPGFRHDPCAVGHLLIQINPLIVNDELQLISKYGLKYCSQADIDPNLTEPLIAFIFPDDRVFIVYRDVENTCKSVEQFSKRDAEAYRSFYEASVKGLGAMVQGFYTPPPTLGSLVSLLDQSEEGREMLRYMMLSTMDILNDWFESEEIKIALSRYVAEIGVNPMANGTGINLFLMLPMMHEYPVKYAAGGGGELSKILGRSIEDRGGTVKTSSPVKSFKVVGGEAKGVILESGEEILAKKAIVTSSHPRQTFLEMLEEKDLPSGFRRKVENLKYGSTGITQHLALNKTLRYTAGEEASRSSYLYICCASMESNLRMFDEFRYGVTRTDSPIMITPTLFDTSGKRAPKGKHYTYVCHYEPFFLADGKPDGWDKIKQEVADGVLDTIRKHTPDLTDDNLLGRVIYTPWDIVRLVPSMQRGDIMQISTELAQMYGNRPLPGYGNYKSPVAKLYMTGAYTHPCGGVSGGSGRAAAMIVMEDLGIDFGKVIK